MVFEDMTQKYCIVQLRILLPFRARRVAYIRASRYQCRWRRIVEVDSRDPDGDRATLAPTHCTSHKCPIATTEIEYRQIGTGCRPVAGGQAWAEIPDTWCCPDCGVREKVDFVPVPVEAHVA